MSRIKIRKKRKRQLNKSQPRILVEEFVESKGFLFWLAHGCNYLNSSLEEGVWDAPFNSIYIGSLYTRNQILSYLYQMFFSDEKDRWLGNGEAMAGWASLSPEYMVGIVQSIKERAGDKSEEPHDETVWAVFEDIRTTVLEQPP